MNEKERKILETWRNNQNFMALSDGTAVGFNRFEYADWMEHQMSRYNLWIGEWANLPTANVQGEEVVKLLEKTCINNISKWEVNQCKHLVCCNEDGKVVAEGIGLKLGEDLYQLQAAPYAHISAYSEANNYNVKITPYPKFYLQISGSEVMHMIKKFIKEDIRDLKFMYNRKVTTLRGYEIEVTRQSMSGDLGGFEFEGPIELRDKVYNEMMEAGQEFGILRMGQRVGNTNHYESGIASIGLQYIPAPMDMNNAYSGGSEGLVGSDPTFNVWRLTGSFDSDDMNDFYDSPYDWGWGRYIDFNHDFIGKEALLKEKETNHRVVVTLEFNNDDVIDIFASQFGLDSYKHMEIPQPAKVEVNKDRIENDKGELIGISSGNHYTRAYRKVISLASIDKEYSIPGTEVAIIWGNKEDKKKRIKAIVAPSPYRVARPDGKPALESIENRRGNLYLLDY